MGAKYCKQDRCKQRKDRPCPVADECFLFKWDIARQQGKVENKKIGEKRDGRKEVGREKD